jgi:tRNA nucleotidyltransferase (CCA-adding enzyme)
MGGLKRAYSFFIANKISLNSYYTLLPFHLIYVSIQAYLVGGAVRHFLLDLEVSDYDIATNATLDQAIEVFKEFKCKKYISKNITIGVKLNHTYFDLSSFMGSTIEEDLSNRDFTVNSMAYHPKYGLIDPYYGLSDLVSKRLKTV